LNEAVLWVLAGVLGTLLGLGVVYLTRRWVRHWRYGTPIAHEELLVAYGRQMAGQLNRDEMGRLLAEDVPRELDVSKAAVLLSEGRNLVATDPSTGLGTGSRHTLRLPVHNAAVRWVASGGEAMRVAGPARVDRAGAH
jgi:hypothetical protein